MHVNVKVIPHDQQRYDTVGDWWLTGDTLEIRVSELGNSYYDFLIALHEQVEAVLCLKDGIREEDVTAFDIMYEKEREMGHHLPDDEPGDDYRAPYRMQHAFANQHEQMLAKQLGIVWSEYEKAVCSVGVTT